MKIQDLLLSLRNQKNVTQTSLFLKLSAFTVFLVLLVSTTWFFLSMKQEKNLRYQEKIASGKMILRHFANKAAIPLMEEDWMTLNALIKEAKEIEGFFYAMILDHRQIIKAHTDPAKVGVPWTSFENIGTQTPKEETTSVTHLHPSKGRVLHLSKPIRFMNKDLGWVAIGLSIDALNQQIKKEVSRSLWEGVIVSGLFLAIAIGGVFLFVKWLSPTEKQKKDVIPEAVRNQVAVLYTGIREFKSYAGSKTPQEVFEDLSEYVSIATQSILDHGGYVIRVAGDTVVGIFQNSPMEGDHIQRAVKGALAIQKTLEAKKQQGSENPLLSKVGIGISSGVVLYGDIKSHQGKQDNYIGESFKAASSLYTLAGPGEIVISRDVYKSIKHWVAVDPLPPREMTHRTEAWESFRLRHLVEREPHA